MIKVTRRYTRREVVRIVVFHAYALQRQSHNSTQDGDRWFGQKHWKGVLNILNNLQESFLKDIKQTFQFCYFLVKYITTLFCKHFANDVFKTFFQSVFSNQSWARWLTRATDVGASDVLLHSSLDCSPLSPSTTTRVSDWFIICVFTLQSSLTPSQANPPCVTLTLGGLHHLKHNTTS